LNQRAIEIGLEHLRALAQEKGIGPTTLIRMWVLERLGTSSAHRH
jgi:hypothetical protein